MGPALYTYVFTNIQYTHWVLYEIAKEEQESALLTMVYIYHIK